MKYIYKTRGTCSTRIFIDTDGQTVSTVEYENGCSGNTQGIGKLVAGMKLDDVIDRLSDIRCGMKVTSCPDQLARALRDIKNGVLAPID